MSLLPSPWIAVDIGSDRMHVAWLTPEGESRTLSPTDAEFSTIFHVSRDTHEIQVGPEAARRSVEDPGGTVLLSTSSLRDDTTIRFPAGRGLVKPSTLFTVLLRHVKEHCEKRIFNNESLRTCVMVLPHRDGKLRRMLYKVAEMAGFTDIRFRDGVVAAATAWQHVWNEHYDYITVCNLGASQTTFTLLRCRCGGSERIPRFHANRTVGVDEIDRIVLKSSVMNRSDIPIPAPPDALWQLKKIRRNCVPSRNETFRFYLNGRKKRIRTEHFQVGTHIAAQIVQLCFKCYDERSFRYTDVKNIPIVLVGGGANVPAIFEAIESVAPGKVFWWAEAEEASVLGTAMMLSPRTKPDFLEEEAEDQFYRLYEKAVTDDAEAQFFVGQACELGIGTPVSWEEAVDWYRLSVRNGSIKGKYGLAKLLYHGLGTVRDVEESYELLQESAERGFAPAQYSLAMFLYENTSNNRAEAERWMRLSADQNYPEAQIFVKERLHDESASVKKSEVFAGSSWANAPEVLVDEE